MYKLESVTSHSINCMSRFALNPLGEKKKMVALKIIPDNMVGDSGPSVHGLQ